MAKYQDSSGSVIEVGDANLNPDLIAGKTLVQDSTPLVPSLGTGTSGVQKKDVALLSSQKGEDIVNTNTSKLRTIEQGYQGPSIVDYKNSLGQSSDFASRKKEAEKLGIPNYAGTTEQNTQYLNILRNISGSPASQKMVDDLNKTFGQGGLTSSEKSGLTNLQTTQDEVTAAAAKARAALESKDYRGMDYWTAKADEMKKKYETDLADYYKSTTELRQRQTELMTPGEREQTLGKQLVNLRTQAEQFKLQTEEDKFREYEGQTLSFAGGRAAELDIRANFKLSRMALEEKNLLLSLGLEQEARKMEGESIEKQLENLASDYELQTKVQDKLNEQEEKLFEMADKLETESKDTLLKILDEMEGVNPETLSPEMLQQLETIAARGNVPFDLVRAALKSQYDKRVFDEAMKRKKDGVEASTKSGTLVYTAQDKSEDSKALEASRGDDGWVDPSLYQKLYKLWVKDGGTLTDFLKEWPPEKYVNPANDWLPPQIRNKKGDDFESF